MRARQSLPILFSLLFIGQSAAGAESQAICYGTDLPRESGPVKSLSLKIEPNPSYTSTDNNGGFSETFDAAASFWGEPGVVITTGGDCSKEDGGAINCGVMCDGGGMIVKTVGDKLVLAHLRELDFVARFESESMSLQDFSNETNISGAYVLTQRPAAFCDAPDWDSVPDNVSLQQGDVSAYIEQAKKALSALGYPIDSVDRILDAQTKTAIGTFQGSVGLPSVGQLDTETLKLLNVHAVLRGGC